MYRKKEHEVMKGFYYIPLFPRYLFNPETKMVYSLIRNKFLGTGKIKRHVCLIDNTSKARYVGIVKIASLVEYGPVGDNKQDYRTLRRSSSYRNIGRSWVFDQDKEVCARCLFTDKKWTFKDLSSLCDYFDLSAYNAHRKLRNVNPCVFNGYLQVYQDVNQDLDTNSYFDFTNNRNTPVVCINDRLKTITIYPTQDDTAKMEGLSRRDVMRYVKTLGAFSKNGCRFIKLSDAKISFERKKS